MGAFGFLLGALLCRDILLVLLILPSARALQYFSIPWSDKKYGPDGPWQAVAITVGGNDSTKLLINENHLPVDLMPGGYWSANILAPQGCKNYTDGTCGKGGMWDPQAPSSTYFLPSWYDAAYGVQAWGQPEILQATTVGSTTFYNTSLLSITNVTVTGNDGRLRGPELGTFPLGADEEYESWGSDTDLNAPRLIGFSFNGALFNKSFTPSYSYALQIGAAAFDYGGSLTFGGYDKGRLIGPYTTFDNPPTLLDIGIGVETGGSPFHFTNMSGLLVSNTSEPGPMIANPDPSVPYLYLPGKTCEAIAKYIPVTFDTKTKYWLWNTTDPNYNPIVSSPAYLSFTFPPAPGALANVTIKVPFSLLNLTLDVPIVSKPVAYFPCQDFTPLSGDNYRLGRAFLQAAFLGRNWNRHISWLAQAPGPGDAKTGLGTNLNDIEDADNDLSSIFTDPQLFAQSWSGHWTPLVEEASPNSTATPSAGPKSTISPQPGAAKKTLSTGAEAGIGVGAAAVALLAAGAIALFLRSRRRKRDAVMAAAAQPPPVPPEKDPVEAQTGFHVPYADNQTPGYYEMEHPPTELDSHFFIPHELPATPVLNGAQAAAEPPRGRRGE